MAETMAMDQWLLTFSWWVGNDGKAVGAGGPPPPPPNEGGVPPQERNWLTAPT